MNWSTSDVYWILTGTDLAKQTFYGNRPKQFTSQQNFVQAKSVAKQFVFLCLLTSSLDVVAQDKLGATPPMGWNS